jgi:hypothetical protein
MCLIKSSQETEVRSQNKTSPTRIACVQSIEIKIAYFFILTPDFCLRILKPAMPILLVGLNHKTAPIEARASGFSDEACGEFARTG